MGVATEQAPPVPAPTNRWLVLAVILAAECMDLLDGTIVNVASPSIRAEPGASLTSLQWIVGGYALTFAVGLVVGGRLGDLYGRRRLFLVGIAGFTLSSVLCGVAGSAGMLIAFRLLQGAFAAITIPQGFGIQVWLKVHIPGMEKADAEKIVEAAHKVCPYSNATRGNVEVALEVV